MKIYALNTYNRLDESKARLIGFFTKKSLKAYLRGMNLPMPKEIIKNIIYGADAAKDGDSPNTYHAWPVDQLFSADRVSGMRKKLIEAALSENPDESYIDWLPASIASCWPSDSNSYQVDAVNAIISGGSKFAIGFKKTVSAPENSQANKISYGHLFIPFDNDIISIPYLCDDKGRSEIRPYSLAISVSTSDPEFKSKLKAVIRCARDIRDAGITGAAVSLMPDFDIDDDDENFGEDAGEKPDNESIETEAS